MKRNYYRLGKYMYRDGAVYENILWFFKREVRPGPLSYEQGVAEVNRLNGIVEPELDYSHLTPLDPEELTNDLEGIFLVNFKRPEPCFGNDPIPAEITPHKERLLVKWVNGYDAVTDVKDLNIWHLPE